MAGTEIIVAALLAGATAGSTEMARTAVLDAYGGLRDTLRERLAGRQQAQDMLDAAEAGDPAENWAAGLVAELAASGAAEDPAVVDAARRFLDLLRIGGAGPAGPVVDAREAKGVQIGDHNVQNNTFR